MLLSRKFGTTSPPFLHVLEPKNRDSEDGGEWQGRIRVLFAKFDKAERAQQQLDATMKTQAAAVNEQVAAVQTKMDERMDKLQATLQAILAASQMPDAKRSAAEEVRRVEKAEAERLVLEKAETAPEPEPETENEAEEEPEPEQ